MEGLHILVDVLLVKTLPSSVVNAEWMDDSLLTEHSPALAQAAFYLRKEHLPVAWTRGGRTFGKRQTSFITSKR